MVLFIQKMDTLGDLDVTGTLKGGTITGAMINGGTIDGGYITGGMIEGGMINGSTISGGSISGGMINGSTITGSSVSTTYLYAYDGQIGGWTIGTSTLTGGSVELNSSGTITVGDIVLDASDSSITGGTLNTPSGGMKLNGYFTIDGISNSYIGALSSDTGTGNDSEGVGIQVGDSYVKANPSSAAIRYNTSSVNIQSDAVQVYGDGIPTKIESTSQVWIDSDGGVIKMGCDYATDIKIGGAGSQTWIYGEHVRLSDPSKNSYIEIGQPNSQTDLYGTTILHDTIQFSGVEELDFTGIQTIGLYATLA